MKTKSLTNLARAGLVTAIVAAPGAMAAETREYIETPSKLTTPDRVETSIGKLKFFDGMPSEETSQLLYDNLDRSRAMQVFLNTMQITTIEATKTGYQGAGLDAVNKMGMYKELMNSRTYLLTGNTDTVYLFGVLDLKRDGHTVFEVPKGSGPSTLNSHAHTWVTDFGPTGPDQGKGGTYVILSPDYKDGDIPSLKGKEISTQGAKPAKMEIGGKMKDVFVVKSSSYVNWIVSRGFLKDGKADASVKMYEDGAKLYSLSDAKNPPKLEIVNLSNKPTNVIFANDYSFYEQLDSAIQYEHQDFIPMEMRGLISSIGITKGKKFAPDARMKKILEDAIKIGNATARTISLDTREKSAEFYKGTQWFALLVGNDYRFLHDGKVDGGRFLDARTLFHYSATSISPSYTVKLVGKGSQYIINSKDKDANPYDGAKTYKLTVPANVPVKDFWSITVYDTQTRSQLQTPNQEFPNVNNKKTAFKENADGSVDIYFGPKAPEGYEKNWIQTVPGKSWFTALRVYGPTEPWFDKSWKLPDIELVD
jgi:hypothetical protein